MVFELGDKLALRRWHYDGGTTTVALRRWHYDGHYDALVHREQVAGALFDIVAEQGCRVLEIREDDSIGLSVIAVSNTLLLQKVR